MVEWSRPPFRQPLTSVLRGVMARSVRASSGAPVEPEASAADGPAPAEPPGEDPSAGLLRALGAARRRAERAHDDARLLLELVQLVPSAGFRGTAERLARDIAAGRLADGDRRHLLAMRQAVVAQRPAAEPPAKHPPGLRARAPDPPIGQSAPIPRATTNGRAGSGSVPAIGSPDFDRKLTPPQDGPEG